MLSILLDKKSGQVYDYASNGSLSSAIFRIDGCELGYAASMSSTMHSRFKAEKIFYAG